MKKLLIPFFLLSCVLAQSQTGTEIYLFDIKIENDQVSISNPQNITNHEGYDNQPNFHGTDPVIYYASFDNEGRSDIKYFNYQTLETRNLTITPEREYSPTLTPDGKFISCIIQRDNGAQDLGKYPVEGGQPIILSNKYLIGYHAWIDESKLLAYVLLDDMGELHYIDLKSGEDLIITTKIGRSLHKIPSRNRMSYIDKSLSENWRINSFDPITRITSTIASTLALREDLCWTRNGLMLMSDGDQLYFLNPESSNEWKPVQINDEFNGLKGITRLAINSENNKLAIVVSE
ncbi:MAG: hypothetical protein CVU00_03840 [Bacteroidetes bacterium HGW-Bacteroidetes-17]|nr:MAG: hypothetical protein CVU00_03840 [Bacteroidetes bacterium HGW-Bacteroidetes-17]